MTTYAWSELHGAMVPLPDDREPTIDQERRDLRDALRRALVDAETNAPGGAS